MQICSKLWSFPFAITKLSCKFSLHNPNGKDWITSLLFLLWMFGKVGKAISIISAGSLNSPGLSDRQTLLLFVVLYMSFLFWCNIAFWLYFLFKEKLSKDSTHVTNVNGKAGLVLIWLSLCTPVQGVRFFQLRLK